MNVSRIDWQVYIILLEAITQMPLAVLSVPADAYACIWVCVFICGTSYSYDNRVENYRVRRNDKGLVTVDDDEYFDNLIKLVEVSI